MAKDKKPAPKAETVYKVVFERNSRAGSPDKILADFFNFYSIKGAQVKHSSEGTFVKGITEDQAKKLGVSDGVNTCKADAPNLATQPGWKSNQ